MKVKKKTVYVIRTRFSDDENWSEPVYYKTKKQRDNACAYNRIIGGIRTHSFQEKMNTDEILEKCEQ